VYIDADASFNAQLNSFIQPADKFILSTELNRARPCYANRFRSVEEPVFLQKRIIVQWLLIAAPRHLFMYRTMVDLVIVVRSIHQGHSVLLPHTPPLMVILCTTGPLLLTNSVSKVIATAPSKSAGFRYVGQDYSPLLGMFKATGLKNDKSHYQSLMEKGTPILKSL
jgi:mannosyltransferase OCH1-like enzyme